MTRYTFLQSGAKTAVAAMALPGFFRARVRKKPIVSAVAFDAYALFDTATIQQAAEQLFPGRSMELMSLWRNRQFEYSWLRVIEDKYMDFFQITGDALSYAAANLRIDLTPEKKAKLLQAVREMRFVPGAAAVLKELKDLSMQLAILSNATRSMLMSAIDQSRLQTEFDFVLSTDSIKTYKPDPLAYQLAVNSFKISKDEILFVAFGGWDAAGAKTFGYRTAWINASGLPPEELDARPDFICGSLNEIPGYVRKVNKAN